MGELRGILPAMVTPFSEDGSLNLGALEPYLEFQHSHGVDGVVVAGTNGEGTSLSVAERKSLLEAVININRDWTVVAGTGAAAITDAVDLVRHASAVGADAALVLPPFFYKSPSAAGISAFFRLVMDASDIPVMLYSIPQFSAIAITDEIIERVSDHPRFAGMKDSAGEWNRTRALIEGHRDLAVFSGSDDVLAQALCAGGVGAISGTANGFPDLVAAVKRAVDGGGDGIAAQARLDAAKSVLINYPVIACSKVVLHHRGVPRMHVRPPLVNLTSEQERNMLAELEAAGVL